jgi:PTS system fructose-specific IIC component
MDLLVPQVRGSDAPTVIQELAHLLHTSGKVRDLLAFFQSALNMESLHSSAMEYGIAFPHARVQELSRACFALGRSAAAIRWRNGMLVHNVHLVFLMALPGGGQGEYVPVVLAAARLHSNQEVMSRIMKASTATEMMEALSRVSVNMPTMCHQ